MNLTARIKSDYGTLKRFALLNNISSQSLYMTLSGYPRQPAVEALMKHGYLQAVDELEDKEAV